MERSKQLPTFSVIILRLLEVDLWISQTPNEITIFVILNLYCFSKINAKWRPIWMIFKKNNIKFAQIHHKSWNSGFYYKLDLLTSTWDWSFSLHQRIWARTSKPKRDRGLGLEGPPQSQNRNFWLISLWWNLWKITNLRK